MIWLAGLPVIWWVAILLADAIQPGRNLFELMEVLTEKLNHPFQFHYTEYTIKSMLVCPLLYAAGIGIFYSSQKNYRRVDSAEDNVDFLSSRILQVLYCLLCLQHTHIT